MNKKYLSLGVLAAIAVVWVIAPLYDAVFFTISAPDLFEMLDYAGLADYLLILAPLAAVVLGVLGVFVKPALSKIGGFVGAGGMVVAILLNIIASSQYSIDVFGWGMWALLVLTIVNLVLNLKASND